MTTKRKLVTASDSDMTDAVGLTDKMLMPLLDTCAVSSWAKEEHENDVHLKCQKGRRERRDKTCI